MNTNFVVDGGTARGLRGAVERATRGLVGDRPDFELLAGPLVRNELRVLAVEGREEMSRCFRFDVDIATPEPELVTEALLGEPATVAMRVARQDERRLVGGIVASIEARGEAPEKGLTCFRLSIVPRLWLLKKKQRSRVFQGKTVPEIVSTVLHGSGIEHGWQTTRAYDPREYCLQYQETDYDFVARLCADEGIFFYFQHPSGLLDAATGGLSTQIGELASVVETVSGSAADLGPLASAGLIEKVVFGDSARYPAAGWRLAATIDLGAAMGDLGGPPAKAARVDAGFSVEGPELAHRPAADLAHDFGVVTDFRLRRTIRSKSVLLTDYDFQRPQFQVQGKAAMKKIEVSASLSAGVGLSREGRLSAEVGVGLTVDMPAIGYDPARFGIHDHDGSQDAKVDEDDARRALEQVRRRALVGRGKSWCPDLAAGHRFSIVDHPVEHLNAEYVCTRVVHTVKRGGEGLHSLAYQNSFQCVPACRRYRPARVPRQLNQVVETGTVVGPPGEPIHVDPWGRIKVHLHWDLDGKKDDTSSCWIRVAQAWAGAASVQFIPRVGMEVLVSFISGDTDRPVVVGSLYNALNPPAFSLPADKTRSGIRTQSVGGEGHSEIVFEDRHGAEYVGIRAQRDLRVDVGNDHELIVGNGARAGSSPVGDQTVHIGRDQRLTVGNDQTITVGGRQRETVDGDRTTSLKGDERVDVSGDLHETIGGAHYEHIADAHCVEVGSGHVLRVGGDRRMDVTGDERIAIHGKQTLSVAEDINVSAGDDLGVTVGRSLSFDAVDSLRFVCGASVIEMRPDEIVITSPKITGAATDTVLLAAKDASFKLVKERVVLATKTEAKITSKAIKVLAEDSGVDLSKDATKLFGKDTSIAGTSSVKLKGKSANIALDSDVAVKGATVKIDGDSGVKLNCGGSDADASGKSEDSTPDEYDTSWIELQLDEPVAKGGDPKNMADAPVPNARYLVEAGGKKYHGTLDANGRARVPIRPGSAKVTFLDYDGDAITNA